MISNSRWGVGINHAYTIVWKNNNWDYIVVEEFFSHGKNFMTLKDILLKNLEDRYANTITFDFIVTYKNKRNK